MVTLMIICTLISIIGGYESTNIIFVNPFSSKSHNIFLRPIQLELARRGHNITVITTFPEVDPPPNYHEIAIKKKTLWEASSGGEKLNIFELANLTAVEFHEQILWIGGPTFTEYSLKTPDVQEFLKQDLKFDVVIANYFHVEAWYILAHKYQAPLILITTFGNSMRHNILLKNPLQQATVTAEFLAVDNPTSFWGRLQNLYFVWYEFLYTKYWYLYKQEELVKKYVPNLPQPVPSLYDIQSNASLTLYNGHFSFDPPTAYLPNIVEIGGLHLFESKGNGVPKELRTILDDATDGFIYVNFGSNVQSSDLPVAKRDALIEIFSQLKQTVLWKWEDDHLKNIPKNVVIQSWFPQTDILSHPNIKLFISHGGLLGTQEAVFHGVPVLGVPVYADQYNNLVQIQDHGMGKMLKYDDINKNTLKNMLNELLKNDSYVIKAKELSKRFRDRPMTPLETAIYWIEYVIRNKGADFMKNPARNLHWVEYSMLDVYAFILIVLIIFVCIIFKAIQGLCVMFKVMQTLVQFVFGTTKKELKQKKN